MFARWWRKIVSTRERRVRGHRETRPRLLVERLEDRTVPATFLWTGDIDNNWTNPINWTVLSGSGFGQFPNAPDDIAQFVISQPAHLTATIPTATTITVGTIQIDGFSPYVITAAGTGQLHFQVTAGHAALTVTHVNGTAAHTLSAPVTLFSPLDVSNDSSAALTVDGGIGQSGSDQPLNKAGAGTLLLAATTYGGGTFVNGGTLAVGVANALRTDRPLALTGGATFDLNGFNQQVSFIQDNGTPPILGTITDSGTAATFTVSNDVADFFSGTLTGNLALAKRGASTLTLSGANTYAGATTVASGTLADGTVNALPVGTALSVAGGATFDLNGFDQQVTSVTGAGTVTISSDVGPSTFTVNNGAADVFAGQITSFLALSKGGAGTLTLTGNSTYTGGTTISAGTLQLGAGGISGSIIGAVTDNGALVFDRSDAVTFAGVISGTGSVTQAGAGTLILSGNSTYLGGTTISAGTLQLGAGGISGSITGGVTDNGALVFDRSDAVTFAGLISGSGSVTQMGGGTLTLTSANTYAGPTTVSAGTLADGVDNALPIGTALAVSAGAVFDLSGHAQQVAAVTGAGTVTSSSGGTTTFAVINGKADTFAGTLAGSLGLTKSGAGPLTLSGANNYAGPTAINQGALLVNGTSTGTGALRVNGGGTLGGTGKVTGSVTVNAGGTVAPGAVGPGTLTVGSISFSPNSALSVDLNGPNPGQFDVLRSTGTVNLGGARLVGSLRPFTLPTGQSLTIVVKTAPGPVSGTFVSGSGVRIGGRDFAVNYAGGAVALLDPLDAFVRALYLQALQRHYDLPGLVYAVGLIRSGAISRYQAAVNFLTSLEARRWEVNHFYQIIFGGPGDPGGVAYWANLIYTRQMSETQVVIAMMTSVAYTASHPDPLSFLRGAFGAILDRAPSATDVALYLPGLQQPGGRAQLVLTLLSTQAAFTQAVGNDFSELLGRAPTASELAFWLGEINARRATPVSLMATLLASNEFYARAPQIIGP